MRIGKKLIITDKPNDLAMNTDKSTKLSLRYKQICFNFYNLNPFLFYGFKDKNTTPSVI